MRDDGNLRSCAAGSDTCDLKPGGEIIGQLRDPGQALLQGLCVCCCCSSSGLGSLLRLSWPRGSQLSSPLSPTLTKIPSTGRGGRGELFLKRGVQQVTLNLWVAVPELWAVLQGLLGERSLWWVRMSSPL